MDAHIKSDLSYTEKPKHAAELTSTALENGYRNFILIGGDGTFHEVVNALHQQSEVDPTEVTLCLISAGTGNDFLRSIEAPILIEEIVDRIKANQHQKIDIGYCSYVLNGKPEAKYFLNVAGLGFDAYVAEKFLPKYKSMGPLGYFIALIAGLWSWKNKTAEINFDGQVLNTPFFLSAIGIGKYFGGGMKVVPDAIIDDGWLDLSLIKDVGKWEVAMQLKNLYSGNFSHHPKVEFQKAKSVKIESEEAIFLQADGEILGHTPVSISIVPAAIKLLI